MFLLLHISPIGRDFFIVIVYKDVWSLNPRGWRLVLPLLSAFAEKVQIRTFWAKLVRIYTEESEFYHFPFVQRLFYINKLSQQL